MSRGAAGPRYRYVVLAVGTGAQATYSAAGLAASVLAPEISDRYGLSLSAVGVLIGVASIGQMLTLLPWGIAADRIGERPVTVIGLLLSAGSLVGAAFASGPVVLAFLLFVAGATGASVAAATGRAVMAWFSARERGFALGLRQTAIPIGFAFAALVLPAVGGLRRPFIVLALVCAVGAVAGGLWLREAPGGEELDAEAIVRPLRDRRLWRLASASSLLVSAQIAVIGFVVLFLHRARGFSTGEAGAVLAGIQVLAAALRVGVGRLSDRLGERLRPMLILSGLLALALGATAALTGAPSAVLLPVLIAAGGLGMSWNGLSFTATAELAGARRSGAALGFQQTALAVAGGVTPFVFAPIVEHTSWRTGYALLVLCPLGAIWLLRGLGR